MSTTRPPIDATFAEGAGAVVVGVMSGTSLDGLDLCAAHLHLDRSGSWTYQILASDSEAYPPLLARRLSRAYRLAHARVDGGGVDLRAGGGELRQLDHDFGLLIGDRVHAFVADLGRLPTGRSGVDLVASHGHTVHHRPDESYTLQIGSAAAIRTACRLPVVNDFRRRDVGLGGQGAPLVPVADRLLFGRYAQCLNLGGFANVSYERQGARTAFDIGPANLLLNRLAAVADLTYDAGGVLAKAGQVDARLFHALNALDYYRNPPPKSLGREWLEAEVWPLFAEKNPRRGNVTDLLATAAQHIAQQLARAINAGPEGEVLTTGGGAHNSDLIRRTRERLSPARTLTIPDRKLVEQKEALAFALLGALRMRGEPNALANVTGAVRDSCGGEFASGDATI